MRALILEFTKKSVITNGSLNSKGAGIPEFIRETLIEFMMHTLKGSKYVLDYEKAELVAAACINQSLQQ